MNVALSALFAGIYIFTPGRRVLCMRQVKAAATAANFTALAAHADACIAHDQETLVLEAKWNGRDASAPAWNPALREIDPLVDTTLTSLRDTLDRQISASKPEEPLAVQGAALLQILFPLGAGEVTNATYPDEAAQVERILNEIKASKWAALVAEFGLGRIIGRLTELSIEYRKLLETPAPSGIPFATVKAARAKGQDNMLQAMAMILGKYSSESEADRAGRETLMGPILRQNDSIGQYLKSRRNVPDVDPDTGEEKPEIKTV